MYYSGKGCKKDDDKAIECFQKAAEAGTYNTQHITHNIRHNTSCSFHFTPFLHFSYMWMHSVFHFYLISLQLGLISGYTWLGFMYQQRMFNSCILGQKTEEFDAFEDEERSNRYYVKAAYKSEPFACDKMVGFYLRAVRGFEDDEQDQDEGIREECKKPENLEKHNRNILLLIQYAYLGLHTDLKVVQAMKDKLIQYLPRAIAILWQKMKVFLLIDDEYGLHDEKKIIFFMMLFECKSIDYNYEFQPTGSVMTFRDYYDK